MQNRLPPDYEKIELEKWSANANNVQRELSSKSIRLFERIKLFVYRFGYDQLEVEEKIRNDDMFAAHFAKEPRREGFHENIAAEWLKEETIINNFTILPKSGNTAMFITKDGNIQKGAELINKSGKSLDFVWNTGEFVCYAMHKYTKASGGNQDSQYKEMVEILQRFQSCKQQNVAFFVIVDGAYYNKKRMEELVNLTRSHHPKSFAVHIEEVPSILKNQYIK